MTLTPTASRGGDGDRGRQGTVPPKLAWRQSQLARSMASALLALPFRARRKRRQVAGLRPHKQR